MDFQNKENSNGKIITHKIQDEYTSSTNNTGSSLINTNKSRIKIKLNSQADLFQIPLSSIIKNKNKLELSGDYYNYLVNEVVTRLEKKQVKEVNLTRKIIKPEINILRFKVTCNTKFEENLKITGNKEFLGNWSQFRDLTFSENYWVFEINKNQNDSPLIFNSNSNKDLNSSQSSSFSSSLCMKYNTSKEPNYFSKNIISQESYFDEGKANNNNTNDLNKMKSKYSDIPNFEFEYKYTVHGKGNVFWEQTTNRTFNLKEVKEKLEYLLISSDSAIEKDSFLKNTGCNLMTGQEFKKNLQTNNYSEKGINSNGYNISIQSINSNNLSIENSKEKDGLIVKFDLTLNSSLEYCIKEKILTIYQKFNLI